MSWSIGFIGTATKVVEALKEEANNLSGASKLEYEAALPYLIGIVEQNFDNNIEAIVKLQASGHGYFIDGKQSQNTLSIALDRFYGKILA